MVLYVLEKKKLSQYSRNKTPSLSYRNRYRFLSYLLVLVDNLVFHFVFQFVFQFVIHISICISILESMNASSRRSTFGLSSRYSTSDTDICLSDNLIVMHEFLLEFIFFFFDFFFLFFFFFTY